VEGYLRQWRAYHKMPSHTSLAPLVVIL